MDLLTQGLMGAAVAQAGMRADERKLATAIGFFSGLLADADILIRSSSDSLLNIEYHRHFSHSLVFIPFGALLAAVICWLVLRHRTSFSRIYLYSLLGFSMSGILDACTSYGTHLLWPFNDERIAWHIISIVDPLFSLVLITGVIASLYLGSYRVARVTLVFCGLYLMAGVFQLQRAEQQMQSLAHERGHVVEKYVVKPTIGNILLWRSVYRSGERYYVDAIRVGLGNSRIYTGDEIVAADLKSGFSDYPPDSTQFKDILRFRDFSDGFLAFSPDDATVLGDIRYSISPTSTRPLWGIVLDSNRPSQHARYEFFREHDSASRQQFLEMLLGH